VFESVKPHIEIVRVSQNGKYGKFIASPFERGYGTTMGNSIRRILLSSLSGVAVSSVKINGIMHEFSKIPGVKEDVIDIILNLKRLAVRDNGVDDEFMSAVLNVSGENEVTAKDILLVNGLEIVNKDLHIATITEPNGVLDMSMQLSKGRGYVSAEENKELNGEIGVIPVDSVYTPIERVNFSVENTRVGNITDYDKVIFEIWTNGTIDAVNALRESAKIMIEQLECFVEMNCRKEEETEQKEEGLSETDKLRITSQPIEYLDLSVRSYNCLKRAGINVVGDLLDKTEDDMLKVRNMGKKSYVEVMEKLAEMGLSLRSEEDFG